MRTGYKLTSQNCGAIEGAKYIGIKVRYIEMQCQFYKVHGLIYRHSAWRVA